MEEKQPKNTPYAVGDGNALDVHNLSDSHDVKNVDARSFDSHDVKNEDARSYDSHNVTNEDARSYDSHDVKSEDSYSYDSHDVKSEDSYSADSHDVINEDARSYDYSDSHNVTTVYVGMSPEDLTLSERKSKYREICKRLIRDGLIDKDIRKQLNEAIEKLSLDRNEARTIENEIKDTMGTSQYLNSADRHVFEYVLKELDGCNANLQESLYTLGRLAKRVEQEEVQFYYYLLLAAQEPSELARKYENRDCDDYWQTYWAYVAYLRLGVRKNAEEALGLLNNWHKESDNLLLAQCVGMLRDSLLQGINERTQQHVLGMMKNVMALSRPLYPLKEIVLTLAQCSKLNFNDTAHNLPKLYQKIFDIDKVCNNLLASQTENSNTNPQGHVKVTVPKDTPNTTNKPTQKSSKKWIIYGVVGLVALFAIVQTVDFKGDKEDIQVPVASTSNKVTDKAEPSTGQKQTGERIKTDKSQPVTRPASVRQSSPSNRTQRQSPKETTNNVQTANLTPAKKDPAVASSRPTTKSANEWVSEGKSNLRKFRDDKAYSCFLEAAKTGDANAFYYLGEIFYNGGNSIERNYSEAFKFYQRAANSGHSIAQYKLGVMYRSGYGCEKNLSQAKEWFRKSAAQGYSKAEETLKKL